MVDKYLKMFNSLKDKIEFDSDVEAIYRILCKTLYIDLNKTIDCWLYILKHYNINELKKDLDFTLLLNEFPIKLIKIIGLKEFFKLTNKIDKKVVFLIDNELFRSSSYNEGIYLIINDYIINNEVLKEKEFIQDIWNYHNINIFDYAEFIKNIILKHLEYHKIDLNYFKELIKSVKNRKEQIKLQALIIDYL